jgi:hypothetical protein
MHRFLALVLLVALVLAAVAASTPSRSWGSPDEPFDQFNATATGRDYTNAYLLALLSYYSYDGEIPGATGDNFEQGFKDFFEPLGLTNFRFVDILGTQAVIAQTDDAVIVTFRGTQQIEDFLTDALIVPTVPEGIHSGFHDWALVGLPGVLSAIQDAGDKKVWLTGHSLGGALAQVTAYYMAAARLIDEQAPEAQGIVTFGSPRVFTALSPAGILYGETYGESRSQRWVDQFDPVPHLVPSPLYLHLSEWTLISVDGAGACSVESLGVYLVNPFDFNLDDHDMRRYSTRIFSLMPEEERVGLPLPPLPSPMTADCDAEANVPPTSLTDDDPTLNSVAEGASSGTPVGITATAVDVNDNDLSYSLTNSAGGRFAIDSSTGIVTVADGGQLDYESAGSHTITVQASDGSASTTADFTISVSNIAPSAPTDSDGASNTVTEGATEGTYVGVTASSMDPYGPAVSYSLADDAGGRFGVDSATGVVSVADASKLDGPANHSITIVSSDGEASSMSTEFTISVLNVAPVIDSIDPSPSSLDEGEDSSVTVSGTFSDPGPDDFSGAAVWSDGRSTAVSIVGRTFSTSRAFPDDDPTTGTTSDAFTVLVTISDDDSASDNATSPIVTVSNLDPVASIDSLDGGLAEVGLVGVPVDFAGSFWDAGMLDTHTAVLDWGDASAFFEFTPGNDVSPLLAQHTYATSGMFTITLTVTDDDGGQSVIQSLVTVLDGAGAAQSVADGIEDILASGGDSAVVEALAAALDELEGNEDGTEENGAIDKLDAGDLVAALVRIDKAIGLLEDAEAAGGSDTTELRLLLALAARSVAQMAYDDALTAAGPSPSSGTQKQLDKIAGELSDGISEISASDYGAAVDDFGDAVKRAVDLLP